MIASADADQLIDGRYRLGEVLGTGGAAVVRRARDERLARDVAVKLFHPGTADPERQSGELSLMASLAHPALVRMYDGGLTTDVNGAPSTYLVMEYVPGPTLHRALDDGPMAGREVAALGAALANALIYLHGRGVVHRDVKPANVLLPPGDDPPAKLGDFGVARLLDGARVTATGMTVGTANYLSPEQALGHSVGPASDVYSLGLLLLEALTGRIAFDGVGVAAAIARLNRQPAIPATVGPAWGALLEAMLRPDPAERPDAAAVRRGIDAMDTLEAGGAGVAAATTSTIAARPGLSTSVLPPARDASGSWPNAYLLDAPRKQRRMRPITVFLLLGGCAAALIVGLFTTSLMGAGTSGSPAAPATPSTPVTPSAPVTPDATPVADTGGGPNRSTAVTTVGKPGTSAVTPTPTRARVHAVPSPPTGHGHGKAKGHAHHVSK